MNPSDSPPKSDKESISAKDSSMYVPINNRSASAYSRMGATTSVQGANPHELINLLFNGLLESLNLARGAMERGETAVKGQAISKSVRLLDEGLKAGLNPQGGELSVNLGNLYDYCIRRLTEANARNDLAAIDEVRKLIEPVADSWKAIRPEATEGN
jgi:flagellar protein FliS